MEMTTIHPAESYLRNETNPPSLYVRIAGKRRRLFINRDRGIIGIIALGKRTKGYVFTDWASIEQIYYPSQEQDENTDRKLILKYQKLARLATHTNIHETDGLGSGDDGRHLLVDGQLLQFLVGLLGESRQNREHCRNSGTDSFDDFHISESLNGLFTLYYFFSWLLMI